MNEGITAYLGAFMDELVRSGVGDVVVSPGSRSAPLALLASAHPELKVWMNIDERSAGFFALGMAKAKRKPVALLCSSGTAAANYMPAVAEAFLSRVPLIVLTADRPHELRDVGAPQTIHQIGLYGSHVKWFAEMPIPEPASAMVRHARVTASRAASVAIADPRGPVHLNFPLREPLIPDLTAASQHRREGAAYTAVVEGMRVPSRAAMEQLAKDLSAARRGMIVCGPHDEPGFADALTELAAKLRCPVLADPLSQLRAGEHNGERLIDGYDAFLRDERVAAQLQPDVILRFGAMPVSKPLLQYLHRYPDCRHIVVDEAVGWREPTLQATDMFYVEPAEFCRKLTGALLERDGSGSGAASDGWLERWVAVNNETQAVLESVTEFSETFEGRLFIELKSLMPRGSVLFAGNSMPIRDLDTFFSFQSRPVRMMANRGANGIDGIVSTALGVSAAGEQVVLVIGDLSFYHDMNGLLAAKLHELSATIIIVNNDGGGIFSFLPQAQVTEHFEPLFGTPIGLDYEHAVRMYGGMFTRAGGWEEFRAAFRKSVARDGLQVIEIRTNREGNVTMHRDVWKKLADRLTPLFA